MKDRKHIAAMDGNEAAAYAAYALTEIAAIYPITPSSPMAEKTDEWSANGKKNIFGQPVNLVEMQSEAGAVGAMHGALEAGALATTFTSSQGLMLMLPTMYRIAGTRQPGVVHVAARTVGTHAMSIFGDHSDVMNCRATGFAMLSSGSVQETADLAFAAHLSAIRAKIPFLHFFDGFRTSHEIQKISLIDYEDIAHLVDREALASFRDNALNPEHPTLRNTVQNPDVYFQVREANNRFYDGLPEIVDGYLKEISRLTGRNYGLFNYYGAQDAERVIVAMGSVSGTIQETVDYLSARGQKVGYLQVHLFRPFSPMHFLDAMPETVQKIAVLDRVKELGAIGEPLYEDVCSIYAHEEKRPLILGGRYGLASKDIDPAQIIAVYENLDAKQPVNSFSVGINDDVTNRSLAVGGVVNTESEGTVCCKFWGLGSDGTVGANKNSIKIIGDYTDLYTQAYFEYDTKKSFGVTKSHLRFGKSPIRGTHLIKNADFVACHNQSYLGKYDIITELKPGGTFLLNCGWSAGQLEENQPGDIKKYIAENAIKLYIIDANEISNRLGLGNRANTVLQAAFFKLAGIIPADDAVKYMKDAVRKTYGKKGDDIVKMNMDAIDAGIDGVVSVEIPAGWANAKEILQKADDNVPDVIKHILRPLNAQKGDSLPVSSFIGYEDGTMPLGTSAYEKRGIATSLPIWEPEHCAQCNMCAYVCPHAVIRPFLMDEKEAADAPDGFTVCQAKGAKEYRYSLQISSLDCTGCGSCVSVCPTKRKALSMKPVEQTMYDFSHWDYAMTLSDKEGVFPVSTVKGSQFRQPLLEFSGACAGCGETPYAKLMTQLFGDRVYWANATGCSQAWGGSMPCVPYTKNKEGKGPAWSNSLFENNAEFSLGMGLAVKHQRNALKQKALELKEAVSGNDKIVTALDGWLAGFDSAAESKAASQLLAQVLENAALNGRAKELADSILARKDQLAKKSIWMYGGDGWAYDIGYGGLDHVFAMGEDVNVLVVDTEVYSNTGGQSSKATPIGAAAQFQSSGKKTSKKDLGRLMMTYGNVYVAQVAMGANPSQLIKALIEADSYPGPSIVIAYTPCIAHGIKIGMGEIQEEMKRAVDSGYWHLYRYNPANREKPFTLDSKEPRMGLIDFLRGETRYSSLEITFPENAKELFEKAEKQAKEKYESYKKMESMTQ